MKMFLHGDIHGAWGDADDAYDEAVERFGTPDGLVQVGDFGYYPKTGLSPLDGKPDPYHYPKESGLWERRFDHPVAFIDGNHEDHEKLRDRTGKSPILKGFSEGVEWEYLKRGVCRDGILYLGGASSVDKEFRLRWGHDWSELENLTREEVQPILDANHKDVKVVVSHTCPSSFDMSSFMNPAWGGENKQEINRVFLEEILLKYKPTHWYFGHWHRSGTGRREWMHPQDHSTYKKCLWQCININEIVYIDTEAM